MRTSWTSGSRAAALQFEKGVSVDEFCSRFVPFRRASPDFWRKAREVAIAALEIHRQHHVRRFQHAVLDYLIAHDELFVPDVADNFEVPKGIRRCFIGAAIRNLATNRVIRKATAAPRYTTQRGRHGNYLEVWRLATDADGVANWRRRHPISPEEATPQPTVDGGTGAA